ncbi:MAG: MgtC/SapB family protein [Burkholderiaceae bacterium]
MDNVWHQVLDVVRQEFSDIPDVRAATQALLRMAIAVALGGMLGLERETHGSAAGLRTHMLVALGSALFIMVPLQIGMSEDAASRILQGVISGIGFLGAGTILKISDKEEVRGLTTAASVWLTCAVGIAAGMGREATALLSAVFALVILALLRGISKRIED